MNARSAKGQVLVDVAAAPVVSWMQQLPQPRSRPAARHHYRHQHRCRAPSTATVASSHCAIVDSGSAACALALTAISAVDAAASSIAAATSELPDGLPQSGSPTRHSCVCVRVAFGNVYYSTGLELWTISERECRTELCVVGVTSALVYLCEPSNDRYLHPTHAALSTTV